MIHHHYNDVDSDTRAQFSVNHWNGEFSIHAQCYPHSHWSEARQTSSSRKESYRRIKGYWCVWKCEFALYIHAQSVSWIAFLMHYLNPTSLIRTLFPLHYFSYLCFLTALSFLFLFSLIPVFSLHYLSYFCFLLFLLSHCTISLTTSPIRTLFLIFIKSSYTSCQSMEWQDSLHGRD